MTNTLLNLKSNRATLTENDCPDELVREAQAKIMRPDFWAMRDDNLDRGKFAKLP